MKAKFFLLLTCIFILTSLRAQDSIKKEYYENGKLKIEIPYSNGKKHGIQKWYFESGKLDNETPFIDNKINGIRKLYFESGELRCKQPYLDGKINGIEKCHYKSGKLKIEVPYTHGKVNGIRKYYYESGIVEAECPFIDGKENGTAKWYYESEKLRSEDPYTDGKINGIAKWYYENGKLGNETPWINGYRNGISKSYYESGKLKNETPWINGKENGIAKWYYESGKLFLETSYTNGITIDSSNFNPNLNNTQKNLIKEITNNNDSISLPFSGIYSLQSLINFDVLDGVALDETAGTISLFGHRAKENHQLHIPYLDYLATAIESNDPTFTLEWTTESHKKVNQALEMDDEELLKRLSNIIDEGKLNSYGEWFFREGGADVYEGMDVYQVVGRLLRANGETKRGQVMEDFGVLVSVILGGKTATPALEKLCEDLGIYDFVTEQVNKNREGKITEQELSDIFWQKIFESIATTYGYSEDRYKSTYISLRKRGKSPDDASSEAMGIFDVDKEKIKARAIDNLFKHHSEIYVPSSIMSKILGVVPNVYPVYMGLNANSLLGCLVLEADTLCKNLMFMHRLNEKIPGYQTYFSWRQIKNYTSVNEGHIWIAPDGFEIIESNDGNKIKFGRTPMRFHIEKYSDGRSMIDPILNEYANELSGLYDEMAQELPVLRQLQECMKIVAISQWLKKKGINISFSRDGQIFWNPPKELPGSVHMAIAVKSGPVGAIISAEGGIDMRVNKTLKLIKSPDNDFFYDHSVKLTRNNYVVSPVQNTNEQINKIFHKKIDVPLPDIPGWVVQATGGKDALGFVTLQKSKLSNKTNCAEALIQLEKVQKKAEMLNYYDMIINARKKNRIDGMNELKTIETKADALKWAMVKDLSDFLFNLNLAAHELIEAEKMVRMRKTSKEMIVDIQKVEKVKNLIEQVTLSLDGLKNGKFDSGYWINVSEEFTKLGVEVRKQLHKTEISNAWVYSSKIATRSALNFTYFFACLKAMDKMAQLQDILQITTEISDSFGNQAKELQQIQKMREKYVKEYVDERSKYMKMVK